MVGRGEKTGKRQFHYHPFQPTLKSTCIVYCAIDAHVCNVLFLSLNSLYVLANLMKQ